MRALRSKKTLIGAVAAASLLLASCGGGGDGDGAARSADGDVETEVAGDGAVGADGEAASDSGAASTVRTGTNAGDQLDGWPEDVWIPTEVDVYGGWANAIDDESYGAQALGIADLSIDELEAAIEAGNGKPSEARDHPSGGYLMEYPDLMEGHGVSFTLIEDVAAGETALTVMVSPK